MYSNLRVFKGKAFHCFSRQKFISGTCIVKNKSVASNQDFDSQLLLATESKNSDLLLKIVNNFIAFAETVLDGAVDKALFQDYCLAG